MDRQHSGFRACLVAGAAAALIALPGRAAAQADTAVAPAPRGPFVGFVIQGAAEFGGDPVASVAFEDGSDQDVNAGQGVSVAAGAELRPSYGAPFGLRATVGYKYLTTKATNVDITLTRVPLELLAFYEFERGFRVGAGVVHQTSVSFDAEELGGEDFDAATGARLELGYRWIALTYTSLQYRGELDETYDASSVGVSFSHTFGRKRAPRR